MEKFGDIMQDWVARDEAARKERADREALKIAQQEHEKRMAAEPKTEEERKRAALVNMGVSSVETVMARVLNDVRKAEQKRQLLEIPEVYQAHARLLVTIANKVLAYQHRKFVIDDNNRDVLRFLLYYFNDCPLAEKVFPERGYKLHKHIMLHGNVGTGKTLLMEIFSEYLHYTGNPNFFYNLSVTQMINYYTLHNNLDRYTFNEEENKGFQCKPVNICLNDIGVQTTTFYGMDTKVLTDEFLHARNEIWSQYHLKAHVTTNLSIEQLKKKYADGFGRLIDRFKTYNVIPLGGESRR
nr:MAG TPA: replicative helicase [Caudoviricetes sp.]